MAYTLKEATIRTNNSEDGMKKINELWEDIEIEVKRGLYKKYVEKDDNGNISACTRKAWEKVYADQKSGEIDRKFTEDYESTVPKEYTKDGKAHCYLYIAIN